MMLTVGVRRAVPVLAALSFVLPANGAPALASSSAPRAAEPAAQIRTLIATSKTAMAITGNVRLTIYRGSEEALHLRFGNGKSLLLQDLGDGLYRVVPPSDPMLLHGNRLCGRNATYIALSFGIRSAVAMDVYTGNARPRGTRNLCGTFNYEQR